MTRILAGMACFLIWNANVSQGQEKPMKPKLVIGGGGSLPDSVFTEFRKLAGPKPSLVVIPTASTRKLDREETRKLWNSRGFSDVTVLHTRDRKKASTKTFIAPLRKATAVWFGGGSQQRIADAYLTTKVEDELMQLLARGGVIGGTSAGAAIQSRVMIAGGRENPDLSIGLDCLPDCIVDQHFLRRNRLPRLLAAVRINPGLTGIGIDEGTALVTDGDHYKVVGKSYIVRVRIRNGTTHVDAFDHGEKVLIP